MSNPMKQLPTKPKKPSLDERLGSGYLVAPTQHRKDYKTLFVRAMKLADKYAGTKKKRWVEGCTEADYLEHQKLKEMEP